MAEWREDQSLTNRSERDKISCRGLPNLVPLIAITVTVLLPILIAIALHVTFVPAAVTHDVTIAFWVTFVPAVITRVIAVALCVTFVPAAVALRVAFVPLVVTRVVAVALVTFVYAAVTCIVIVVIHAV